MKWYDFHKFLCLFLPVIFYTGVVSAHGGVEIKGNQCILTAGPFQMLFTGYQPTITNEPFCDDIPAEGDTIIVLDFIDKILRTMPTDYRVIRDTKGLGLNANVNNIGTLDELESDTVFYAPAQTYLQGTFSIEGSFPAGNYIGIVTIKDEQINKSYYSVFPFSVGQPASLPWAVIIGGLLLLILGVVLVVHVKRS